MGFKVRTPSASTNARDSQHEARIVAKPTRVAMRAYAEWLRATGNPVLAQTTDLIAQGTESEFGRFVKETLRPLMPNATYAKKVRPCWAPSFPRDHEYAAEQCEFRGLAVAKPTKTEWLREQGMAFHIVKFSLHDGAVELLQGFPRVVSLDLRNSRETDYSALIEIGTLRELDLWHSHIRNLDAVGQIRSLRWLQLYHTPVSDLSPLAGLDRVACLSLCECRLVEDIDPLRKMTGLKKLNMSKTSVTDLSPLADLKNLEQLWARNLKPMSLEPLYGLSTLKRVDLAGSKVSRAMVEGLRKALPQADIRA